MAETWVVNASPVITLAKAGYLHILSKLAPRLVLPEPVASELIAAPANDPARKAVEAGWCARVTVERLHEGVVEWGLGRGESAVLTVAATTRDALAVVDDAEARKCASTLGIPKIGTLGVVLRAKLQGEVESASEVLRALRDAGLYLDDRTIAKALDRGVGEVWRPEPDLPRD